MDEHGAIARRFHEATKHTYESVRVGGRSLDWENKPRPFKVYADDLEVIEPEGSLARILSLGAGVLRKRDYGGETIFFRTYASAGALYPVEVYVVDQAGVFHFDPLHKVLERLREGDHRGALVAACASDEAVERADRSLVLTGIPWRTGWKYGERGYRHLFWDAGTILANILELAASDQIATRVVLGFDDGLVSRVVSVDGVTEFPVCIVALGETDEHVSPSSDLPDVDRAADAMSPREERFPGIEEVHAAGRLEAGDVAVWRRVAQDRTRRERVALEAGVEKVIRRRGSARRFGPGAIPHDVLRQILAYATQGSSADHAPAGSDLVRVYASVHAVDGLDPGTYEVEGAELRRLMRKDVRMDTSYLCLGQRLGGSGAATLFLMVDLADVLERFGDRGYRVAQLEGGLALGRADLATHAAGFGATGLTFFDDDVRGFFGLGSSGLECMVVCAVGERRGRLLPLA